MDKQFLSMNQENMYLKIKENYSFNRMWLILIFDNHWNIKKETNLFWLLLICGGKVALLTMEQKYKWVNNVIKIKKVINT